MRLLPLSLLALALALPPRAVAQDDLLAPLSDDKPKSKHHKPKKKPAHRKGSSGSSKEEVEDDLLAPVVSKTLLDVQVAGGMRAKLFVDGKEIGPVPAEPVEIAPSE